MRTRKQSFEDQVEIIFPGTWVTSDIFIWLNGHISVAFCRHKLTVEHNYAHWCLNVEVSGVLL